MEGSLQRRRAIDLEFMVELDCIPGFTKEVDGKWDDILGIYNGNICSKGKLMVFFKIFDW